MRSGNGSIDRVLGGLFDLDPGAEVRPEDLDAVAARLQTDVAAPPGYLLRRVILVNYWHFDYLDLVIPHGRLFLLGENGSGKSTVLGATLPMLLDGVIRPERLDTFGSSHRRIDHYVLGQSSDGTAYPRRTSLVALEFAQANGLGLHDGIRRDPVPELNGRDPDDVGGWAETAENGFSYLTIGICFAGNVDSPEAVRPYRFILTDGKRLGFDLPLVDRHQRVYEVTYLRQVFREHGVVAERQAEYQELVARHLFGFRDARAIDHLVEVLLLLRRPGLSNELRTFTDVYEYLKRALPPLPEEVTQTTTEAFARIDELRHQERRLTRQADSCAKIYDADRALAVAKARQRALPVVLAEAEAARRHAVVAAKREALDRAERARSEAEAIHGRLQADLATAREDFVELEGSARGGEAAELERRLRQAEAEGDQRRQLLADRERLAGERRQVLAEIRRRLAARAKAWAERREAARGALDALKATAESGYWAEAAEQLADLLAVLDSLDRARGTSEAATEEKLARMAAELDAPFAARMAERRGHLEDLDRAVAEVGRAEAAEAEARRRLAVRQSETAATRERLDEARGALAGRWDELVRRAARVTALLATAGLTGVEAGFLDALATRDRERLGAALGEIEPVAARRDENAAEEGRQVGREIGRLRAAIERAEAELDRIRGDEGFAPVRSPRRREARDALGGLGLDARPLYALIDFAPRLPEERRGAVERALEDAGLLDALVLRSGDAASAQALLWEHDLADCCIADGARPARSVLGELLVVDDGVDDPGWRDAAVRALRSIGLGDVEVADAPLSWVRPDGTWGQGVLRGSSGRAVEVSYVGATNRRARREAEIARRGAEIEMLGARVSEQEEELARLDQGIKARADALRAMHHLVDDRALATAEAQLQERLAVLRQAEAAEGESAAALAAAGEQRVLLAARLADRAIALVGVATPDAARVRAALRAVDRLDGGREAILGELRRLRELGEDQQADQARLAEGEAELASSEAQRDEAREKLRLAEESIRHARAWLESDDFRDFQRQREVARERVDQLAEALLRQTQRLGSLGSDVEALRVGLDEAADGAGESDAALAAVVETLRSLLDANPDVLDGEADAATDPRQVAHLWCSTGDAQESLDRDAEQARDRRRAVFDEEQRNLVDYNLAILSTRDRVIAQRSAQVEQSLAELLRAIQGQIEDTRLLLDAEEERLFKDYLCDTGLNAIHRSVQAAEGLVWRINDLLARTPLGGERYELRLESAERHDDASPLARHHTLFRKDPLAITEDERRVLFEAVRSAVAQAHRRSTEEGGAFADLLTRAFDYREWYTLHLYVTDPNGRRQRISSRTARARSGAQQLFALYVPLFAALAALYRTAEPWAPRLFAMDEAFDKVSDDNVALLLRFLVDLGFQWIVASPRLSGAGRDDLPACADWQLCHDATAQLAQAIPFLYWHGQPPEEEGGGEPAA